MFGFWEKIMRFFFKEQDVTNVGGEAEDILKIFAQLDKRKINEAIQKICTNAIKRFRQELAGENEDLLDRSLRKYRSKVARRTWRVAQNWCKWAEDGPVLMPDYTRLYFRKGNTEVVIQEFPPQMRLMKFKSALALRNSTNEPVPGEDKTHAYTLALPYLVFLHRIVGGVFQDCYVAFCDRPLKTLRSEERPLRPYLSNLDSNLKLCHGLSLQKEAFVKGDIVQQIALVMNNFWSTVYSDEWSSHFWANKRHFLNDERMGTMEKWQQASLDNPLFVVEDVSWLPHSEQCFGDMIVRLVENDSVDASFQQELYNDLIENFIEEVKKVLEENFSNVNQNIIGTEDLAETLLTELLKLNTTN